MYIIEVIPIARGTGAETLSYFCPAPIALGAVIDVPVRKKIIQGVVVAVREAVELKSDLRQASFSLKKIPAESAKKARPFFTKEFMATARQTAEYYAATVGSTLAALVPEIILAKSSELKTEPTSTLVLPDMPAKEKDATKNRKNFFEVHAIQGDDEERYGSYRGLIRQEFARKSSVLFLVPSAEEAEHAYELIEKGIEGYAHILHSGLSKKRLVDSWNKIVEEEHPVVVVATGSFLSIPRRDIGVIIVEKENSRGWKQLRRPFADIRRVAETYAKERNIPLFFGDMFLSVETLWRQSEDEIIAGAPFKFRTLATSRDTLVDMRTHKKEMGKTSGNAGGTNGGQFKIFSGAAEELIKKNKANNEHMIMFALRRGVSPSVVCTDCQTIVTCNECSKPVVLHRAPAKAAAAGKAGKTGTPATEARSFFLCHRCGARRPSEETCKNCGSWKLATVGIGIDLVAEKIRDKFPDMKLFQIDSDSTPNDKQAHAVVAAFRAQPSAILLGTEMMLSYLHEKVENAVIVSLDSLLSIPDFRIHEKILHVLLSVRALARSEVIIQTRKGDEAIFDYAMKGNLNEFFRAALAERKTFSYPPFSTLIKLTLEGKKDEIVAEMTSIKKTLEEISTSHTGAPYAVDIFPAFTHTVRGNFVLHGLIRIPRVSATVSRPNWPDAQLSAALRALPPSVTVNIDPDTLL